MLCQKSRPQRPCDVRPVSGDSLPISRSYRGTYRGTVYLFLTRLISYLRQHNSHCHCIFLCQMLKMEISSMSRFQMPRIPRLVVPGHPHHVTQRGNRRQRTFFNVEDYQTYLEFIITAKQNAGCDSWATVSCQIMFTLAQTMITWYQSNQCWKSVQTGLNVLDKGIPGRCSGVSKSIHKRADLWEAGISSNHWKP
jgi:hypothetical protein